MKQSLGGVRLQQWLRDERRSQAWLANELDVWQPTLSRWIRGGPPPPLKILLLIRSITGVSLESWSEDASSSPHRKAS